MYYEIYFEYIVCYVGWHLSGFFRNSKQTSKICTNKRKQQKTQTQFAPAVQANASLDEIITEMMVGEEVFKTKETGAPTAPNEIVLLTALFNALFSDQWEAVLNGRLKFGGGMYPAMYQPILNMSLKRGDEIRQYNRDCSFIMLSLVLLVALNARFRMEVSFT